MELDFVKLHGLGNDFIFIDDFSREVELTTEQVSYLCDRHKGIGADGVILVRPSEDPDCLAYMHYINSDGSLAQMCGNGVRCFAKYLVDRGFVHDGTDELMVDTLAGPKHIRFTRNEDGLMDQACVDMGHPILDPCKVPALVAANHTLEDDREAACQVELENPFAPLNFTLVSMGNPHAICIMDDFSQLSGNLFEGDDKNLSTLRVHEIGAFFEKHDVFPEKSNIEFIHPTQDGLEMRVFERGCGETQACGTGACASLVAAVLTNRSERENTLHLLGGDLSIRWGEDDHVYMTGPAEEVFVGTIHV